jgi:glycosyltransferase involved in cell wall biosynthesis
MKKNILVISNTAFSVEKFRLHYFKKLSKTYNIQIYTPDRINISNYNNLFFKSFGNNNFLEELFIIKKILEKNVDLILAYSFKYQFYLFMLNLFYQKKVINIIAGRGTLFLIENNILRFVRDIFFYLFFKYSDNFVFTNPEDKLFFKKKYLIKKNIFTIPTEGFEIIKRKQSKLNKKKFLFFSRLIKEKGIFEFIELAKKINQKFSYTQFFIAGSFDRRIVGQTQYITKKKLLKRIENYNFIKFIGFKKKNIPNFLCTMDCLISPSYAEGAGQSVMESILSGLYVVVFKNSGHKYVLNNEKKFICKNNSARELCRLTYYFINENKNVLRKTIYKSQNYIIKNFSSTKVYEKIIHIIDKVCDKKN